MPLRNVSPATSDAAMLDTMTTDDLEDGTRLRRMKQLWVSEFFARNGIGLSRFLKEAS